MGNNDLGSTPPSGGGGGGGMTREECNDHLLKISRTPKVRIVLGGLDRHKCRETTYHLWNCNEPNLRGLHHDELGVIICHDNAQSYEALEATFLHELIHEYDHCRFPKMIKKSIYDQACTEIRAYRLGNNYEPEIVKACAISSLDGYPEAEAKSAVEAMWDTCYNDTTPFVGPDKVNWGSGVNDKVDTK